MCSGIYQRILCLCIFAEREPRELLYAFSNTCLRETGNLNVNEFVHLPSSHQPRAPHVIQHYTRHNVAYSLGRYI